MFSNVNWHEIYFIMYLYVLPYLSLYIYKKMVLNDMKTAEMNNFFQHMELEHMT